MNDLYSIGEFAKKTSTTIRTLHHYDELELLIPSYINESGRRFYSDKDFVPLQRILTLKYLGYSLEQIKELLQSETWNLKQSLQFQHSLLKQKMEQIERVMKAIKLGLQMVEENEEVDPAIFISMIHNLQHEEDQKEWLKEVLHEERIEELFNVSADKQLEIEKKWAQLNAYLKTISHLPPEEEIVQAAIAKMMALVREISGDELELLQEMANVEVKDDSFLFHSPFTPEEEEWLSKALQFYLREKGVNLNGNN